LRKKTLSQLFPKKIKAARTESLEKFLKLKKMILSGKIFEATDFLRDFEDRFEKRQCLMSYDSTERPFYNLFESLILEDKYKTIAEIKPLYSDAPFEYLLKQSLETAVRYRKGEAFDYLMNELSGYYVGIASTDNLEYLKSACRFYEKSGESSFIDVSCAKSKVMAEYLIQKNQGQIDYLSRDAILDMIGVEKGPHFYSLYDWEKGAYEEQYAMAEIFVKKYNITKENYPDLRGFKFGVSNPTKRDNRLHAALIENRMIHDVICRHFDYSKKEIAKFDLPWSVEEYWHIERYGKTTNRAKDGRIIDIGGQTSFQVKDEEGLIYNDVIVYTPGGGIEIFDYHPDDFEPLCYHGTVLLEDKIFILGGLSNTLSMIANDGQILYCLNLNNYRMDKIVTHGDVPERFNLLRTNSVGYDYEFSYDCKRGALKLTYKTYPEDNIYNYLAHTHMLELKSLRWEYLTPEKKSEMP